MTLGRKVLKRIHSPLKSPRLANTSLRRRTLLKQIGDVQMGDSSKANLKVVVRVRPFNHRETENNAREIVKLVDDHMLVFDPPAESSDFFFKGAKQEFRDLSKRQNKEQKFMFERIFHPNSTNEDVYEATTKDLIDTILKGFNCSVFAYGATGAGKTFTMLGSPHTPGITFLTVMDLYKRIEQLKEEKTCEIAVSYLEVYNETVRDLLKPGKALMVQESGNQIVIPNLSLHKPKAADELLEMLASGNKNRSQHPTDMNAESSRSHAVFQVFVKMENRIGSLSSNVCIAKLSMIDLAGSERGMATGFKGARFREGASINRSLLALGNCINALADGQKHIPYRDSKLTRLLKDSLGGNCRSVMVAAISSASTTFEDTFNTLRYANRAKTIKMTVKKNVLNINQHVSQYVKIIENLKDEISSLQEKIKQYEEASSKSFEECEIPSEAPEKMKAKLSSVELILQTKLTNLYSDLKLKITLLQREEACEKQLDYQLSVTQLHIERANIVSFASLKLDKSVVKSNKKLGNLKNSLDGVKCKIEELKLAVSDIKSQISLVIEELKNIEGDKVSESSQNLLEKCNLEIDYKDGLHMSSHLRNMLKESLAEQSSSELIINNLLICCKQLYLHFKTPGGKGERVEKIFQNVVSSLDLDKKVVFANESSDVMESDASLLPSVENMSSLTFCNEDGNLLSSPVSHEPKCKKSILKSFPSSIKLLDTNIDNEEASIDLDEKVLKDSTFSMKENAPSVNSSNVHSSYNKVTPFPTNPITLENSISENFKNKTLCTISEDDISPILKVSSNKHMNNTFNSEISFSNLPGRSRRPIVFINEEAESIGFDKQSNLDSTFSIIEENNEDQQVCDGTFSIPVSTKPIEFLKPQSVVHPTEKIIKNPTKLSRSQSINQLSSSKSITKFSRSQSITKLSRSQSITKLSRSQSTTLLSKSPSTSMFTNKVTTSASKKKLGFGSAVKRTTSFLGKRKNEDSFPSTIRKLKHSSSSSSLFTQPNVDKM